MMSSRRFKNLGILRPVQIRKFPFLIDFRKIIGVGLKYNPFRYWTSSVFVLSMVTIECAIFCMVFEISMYHSTSNCF